MGVGNFYGKYERNKREAAEKFLKAIEQQLLQIKVNPGPHDRPAIYLFRHSISQGHNLLRSMK